MIISDLIGILQNKIETIRQIKLAKWREGDMDKYIELDNEQVETEETLNKLRSVQ